MLNMVDMIRPVSIKNELNKIFLAILTCLILACELLSFPNSLYAKLPDDPTILIFNSYHKGYSWSDQIVNGIESSILHAFPGADIRVEYLDTKRNSSKDYLAQLSSFYWQKYREQQFDLIFVADDNAINLLLNWEDSIIHETPIVFCGANSIDDDRLVNSPQFTGIMEYADIRQTLDTALQLKPATRKLVVINDNTFTGFLVGKEFERVVTQLKADLEIIRLPDLPLSDLAEKIAEFDEGTVVLLLAYLTDRDGTYYDPKVTSSLLSEASRVPIFSVWDFYFNHGIVGGVLTSGFLQGEAAAELGIRILHGEDPANIPIVQKGGNQQRYDYRQLQRFDIPVEKIPKDAQVKNITYGKQRNILILNSYSAETAWTQSIMTGIREHFADTNLDIKLYVEYMDTKEFFDKPYMHTLVNLLKRKYTQLDIDLIVTSDDNAFNFVRQQRPFLFKNTPLVFCGVNYLKNAGELPGQNITGVIEDYDILGTIQMGLTLFPKTEKIFVVNDDTTSGQSNKRRLEQILPSIPSNITLEQSGQTSMLEVQQKLSKLQKDTLVLLMSFTRDKNNYHFSYKQSAELITGSSVRPVLGFWDFYLGNGILGGAVTTGLDQGRTAAALAIKILEGEDIRTLPVVVKSPVTPYLDYAVMNRFGIAGITIPADVEILNQPPSILKEYRAIVLAIIAIFVVLFVLISAQSVKILFQKKTHKDLFDQTETDPLTGAKNRNYLTRNLSEKINMAVEKKEPLTLCYFDLDNLKGINDTLGHDAGDSYIMLAVESIRNHIRVDDTLCRVGGDEFIIVLPNCTAEKANHICNQVNKEIQESENMAGNRVGLSCGISEMNPSQPLSAEELVTLADQKMYTHKMARKAEGLMEPL